MRGRRLWSCCCQRWRLAGGPRQLLVLAWLLAVAAAFTFIADCLERREEEQHPRCCCCCCWRREMVAGRRKQRGRRERWWRLEMERGEKMNNVRVWSLWVKIGNNRLDGSGPLISIRCKVEI
ncbi:hypothetical protein KY289_037289 [Solanum tuberosum]|nr:hypothetical protein KY289_037289 [Solanum tuberosum]